MPAATNSPRWVRTQIPGPAGPGVSVTSSPTRDSSVRPRRSSNPGRGTPRHPDAPRDEKDSTSGQTATAGTRLSRRGPSPSTGRRPKTALSRPVGASRSAADTRENEARGKASEPAPVQLAWPRQPRPYPKAPPYVRTEIEAGGGQHDHHDPGGVTPRAVQGGNQFGVLLRGHAGVDVRGAHTDGDLVGDRVLVWKLDPITRRGLYVGMSFLRSVYACAPSPVTYRSSDYALRSLN